MGKVNSVTVKGHKITVGDKFEYVSSGGKMTIIEVGITSLDENVNTK